MAVLDTNVVSELMRDVRQLEMGDGGMVAGAVAVGDHPDVLAGVHVDGGDAAVAGLQQGQPQRALGDARVPRV